MLFTADHDEPRRALQKFIAAEINPHVDEWEKADIFPAHELFKKLGDLGFLGLNKPVEFGGQGLDYSYALMMAEELGAITCGGVPMAIGVQTDMATPALARFGSDEVRREFLAPAIAGDQVACIGVSEPGAGSDVASIKTNARSDGDDYVINGGKMWITNGTQADWICLLANTSDGQVHRNKSLICVPMKTKGVQVARKLDKLGMRSSDTAQIFFDNVRVPKRNRIGEEGQGFTYQMIQFQEERLWGAAACLKAHEFIINETIEYTRNRKAFGGSILDNQVVHFKLAEMQTEVELLRSLIYRAAEALVAGEDVTRLATMAKLKAGRLGRELTDACLQYWGGMGFTNETPVSRAYRDSRLTSIGGGADEVMLMVLCKMMGTLPGLEEGKRLMITLYHCDAARSFRPLWMLEELGLPYELKMLPFPPRVFAKEYLGINPLGTIPFMVDGETKMTESSGICHYLGTKYGPTPLIVGVDEPAYGAFLNWMYFSDATLTFPQTLVLRYSQLEPEERRNPQVSGDYAKWFLGRLRAVEAAAAKSEFLCAERFTAADIANGYALRLASNIGLAKDFGPNVAAYWARLQQRDGYKRAVASEQKAGLEQNVAPRPRP